MAEGLGFLLASVPPLSDRPLELCEVGAREHDTVGVVHLPVVGYRIRRSASVLGDEDRLRAPQRLHMARRPIQGLGIENVPGRLFIGMLRYPGASSDGVT
jgi:hypothetical protein